MSNLTENIINANILNGATKLVEQLSVVMGLEHGEFSVNDLLQPEFLEPVQQIQQPEQSVFRVINQKNLNIYRR
ncbi:hypothetical protein D1B17_05410 [Companilactobacillus zhachilii]|jgi:hypothetical protein|uniref:Uncharacterized protein n=1 Tax=Companilactobacillus zhachilii TaxID=2304606 RepID=A0A386PTC8_9LACO|nr:hypothetical protein [Companilactobacillus zhachilii]AYE38099.1 hypothetical protein D1B17_05410 [Companilactobacillus zhachilii]